MKKYYYLIVAALMMGTMTFVSCNDDDNNTPTEQTAVLDFENSQFTALIDNPQYGGSLIYSANEYKWTDTETKFSGECVKSDWGNGSYGWGNGAAISNYVEATITDNNEAYKQQLAVTKSNGSRNFAVIYDNGSKLSFADGQARIIKSMQVINTLYALGNSNVWGSIKQSQKDGYKFTVTVTADNGASKEIVLAENTTAIEDWTNVDLSSLGKVKSLTFTFDGTDKSTYSGVTYLNTPKYVAIDNIVVVK